MTDEKKLEEQTLTAEENQRASLDIAGAEQTKPLEYDNTMKALKEQEYAIPSFSSSYDDEIKELYKKIVNREGFQYRPSADPLYGVYRDQYTREGRLAMQNSIGQAAALTGGYGSSYGQAVGQQQYDQYLQKLGDVLPELYSNAYKLYEDEGNRLSEQYDRATGLADAEYGRYRDKVGDAQFDREMDTKQQQQEFAQNQTSFETLVSLIEKTGYQPSEEELQKVGMSSELVSALKNEYLRKNGLLSTGGSASSASSYTAIPWKENKKFKANTGKNTPTTRPRRS